MRCRARLSSTKKPRGDDRDPLDVSENEDFEQLSEAQKNPLNFNLKKLYELLNDAAVSNKDERFDPRIVPFNAALSKAERDGSTTTALTIIKTMLENGVTPDLASFTFGVSTCERAWDSRPVSQVSAASVDCSLVQLSELVPLMRKEGVQPNVAIYNALIGAFARANDGSSALEIFRLMQRDPDPSVTPDGVTYSSLISSCKRAEESMAVLAILKDRLSGARATEHDVEKPIPALVYENALLLCWQWNLPNHAWEIWNAYLTKHPSSKPTMLMCEYSLQAVAEVQSGTYMDSMLASITQKHNLNLSPLCYEALLKNCAVSGEWKRAIAVLRRTQDESLAISLTSYHYVIDALRECGEWEKAVQILRVIQDKGVSPTTETYNRVFAACSIAESWKPILSLYDEMSANGTPENAVSQQYVIMSLWHLGMLDEGQQYVNKIQQNGGRLTPLATKIVWLLRGGRMAS